MTNVRQPATPTSGQSLRVGVAGLGRAFTLMLPALAGDRRIRLVAAADPRAEATERFAAEFGARTYASIDALCADDDVDVVYVATPHQHHAAHVAIATAHGKHVLVEKPMAITLAECQAMVTAAEQANVSMVVGHSHSFDLPILRTREMIASGAFGAVRMINAQYYTDFMYRPRRPEELITERGGGVLFSQGAHQVDIVRLLGGGRVRSVRAHIGAWDPARPSEGAYAALLRFEDGTFASLVYSGYAHFDADELCGGVAELGGAKDPAQYGAARSALRRAANADGEAILKNDRGYGGAGHSQHAVADANWHEHFGMVLVCCDRADLRPLPTGVMIYGDDHARLDALPKAQVARAEVVNELYETIVLGRPPVHSGTWAMATVEVCVAILQSAREQREIVLEHQCGLPA